jgi:protein ImuB
MTSSRSGKQAEVWLYLNFPLLALEATDTADNTGASEQACAVVSEQGAPRHIVCCNQYARNQGIEPGLSLPTALALFPDLQVRERQPAQEKTCLQRLALLAYRFSPTVILNEPDDLWLGLAGCKNLFGSYQNLLQKLQTALSQQAITVRAGIGQSPPAARLLCQNIFPDQVPCAQTLQSQVANASLDRMVLSDRQRQHFKRLGLNTVGQLLALSRPALGRRFGSGFLRELELLTGELPCQQPRFQPPPRFFDEQQNPDGINSKQGLLFPMKTLLQRLCHYLIARQSYCAVICWRFEPLLGKACEMRVQLSASQHCWSSLLTLTRLQLERLSLPGSIERVILYCDQFAAAPADNLDFFGDRQSGAASKTGDASQLIDQFNARLGSEALSQPATCAQYLPEQAGILEVLARKSDSSRMSATLQEAKHFHPASPRPTWLLPNPVPVQQRGNQLMWRETLTLQQGPERLCSNWWQHSQQRDYYLSIAPSGARYWVFRERHSRRWFVHGIFA